MQKNRFSKLELYNKPIGKRKDVEVVPERDRKTSSWMRVDGTDFS
jgi:hypothetical protein